MTRLDKIERDVAGLSRKELVEFRTWFDEFDAGRFDKAISEDTESGKLHALADVAVAEFRAGKTRPL